MASEGAVADLSGGDDTCAAEAVGSDECKSTEAAGAVTVENKYEVEIVNIERQYTVGIRKVVPVAEIAEFFRPAVENVLAFAEKNNLPKPEMTYGRYYKYDKKIFDVECGIIVPKGTKGEGDLKPNSLPAGKAAMVFHYGSMNDIGNAYEALESWMRKEGRLPGGCPFEYHNVSLMCAGDESKFKTQIFFPLLTIIPPAVVKLFRR